MVWVLGLCRQWQGTCCLEWEQEILLEWLVKLLLLAHPDCLRLSLWSMLHDLALLVDPSWQEQCLLLTIVRVVLFIVHQQTLEHVISFFLGGNFSHLAVNAHAEC